MNEVAAANKSLECTDQRLLKEEPQKKLHIDGQIRYYMVVGIVKTEMSQDSFTES